MVSTDIRAYLATIGRKGGRKSRRTLSSDQAREMVAARLARRAFRDFHAQCFWSFDRALEIDQRNAGWVADRLRRNGNRAAWKRAAQIQRLLCR